MNKNSLYVVKAQKRKKLQAVERFGGACQLCGYNKCMEALDFHHLDKSSKEQQPSYVIANWSPERAFEELKKCILICSNCHREIHSKPLDLELKKYDSPIHILACKWCTKSFSTKIPNQKYCSYSCMGHMYRKVERPSKDILEKEILTESFSALGRKYGVSDNAVRKWCKKYKILF